MFAGFRKFIAQGNAIDLAVGVVIGGAFGKIVTGIVESFINPLVALLFGAPNFNDVGFKVGEVLFPIGHIITAVINFLLIAFAVYFFIVLPINKMKDRMKKPEAAAPAATPEDIMLLREIRDALQRRS